MMRLSHNDSAIWFVIFVFLVFLVGNFIFTQYEILQMKNSIGTSQTATPFLRATLPPTSVPQGLMSPSPVATPTPTSAVPTIFVSNTPTPVPALRVTYIPLSGGTSQSMSWVDVSGSGFSLNIGDYGSRAYAIWDANIRVDNANGTTYVRLFDKTHGIAIDGSEISITNTSTSTDVISGRLSFWQGNNSYVVQIKSLNSYTAFMDSGRIKINY